MTYTEVLTINPSGKHPIDVEVKFWYQPDEPETGTSEYYDIESISPVGTDVNVLDLAGEGAESLCDHYEALLRKKREDDKADFLISNHGDRLKPV